MTPPQHVRGRLTFANVSSALALALVLGGGTAYAAGLVGTDDIKKGAVTTPKIAKNAVRSAKIKNGTVKPADLAVPPVTDAVVRTAVITFTSFPGGTGQYLDTMASCDPGEQVLGGGFDISPNTSVDGQANIIVLDSRPSLADEELPTAGSPATGWSVEARRYKSEAAGTVNIWVLCG